MKINILLRVRFIVSLVILFTLSVFQSESQVSFVQTNDADFQLGFVKNTYVSGNSVSVYSKGTAVSNWLTTTVLPQILTRHRVATWKNTYVYLVGGNNGTTDVNTVYRATLQTAGISGWTAQTVLPVAVTDAAVVIGINMIYVIGGNVGGVPSSAIYYASLAADGTVGTWQTSTVSLPAGLWGHTAAYVFGRLYVVGGSNLSASNSAVSTVYTANILPNGNLSSFTTGTSLPAATNGHTMVDYNETLFVMGGFDNAGVRTNAVYYSAINSDGTNSAWQTANSLPGNVSNHSSTCFNGLVTAICGKETAGSSDTLSKKMYYANIADYPNFTWTLATNDLYDQTENGQAFACNGQIVFCGGDNLAGVPSLNCRYNLVTVGTAIISNASFTSNPFFQLGNERYIQNLAFTLTPAGVNYTMYYRLAGNDEIWGDWVNAGVTTPSVINQTKRYVQYMVRYTPAGITNIALNDVTLNIQGTQLSGNLNTSNVNLTAAASPYWATANISYTAGTHNIEAGVTILFSPGTGLEIGQANMNFNGTALNPVKLTYYTSDAGNWTGVYFDDNSDNGVSSSMNYTIIEKAGYGTYNTNLYCVNTNEPHIQHSIFRESVGLGIRLDNSNTSIETSSIENNTESGLSLSSSNPTLVSTVITDNDYAGVYFVNTNGVPSFVNSSITNNLYAYYSPSPDFNFPGLLGTVSITGNTYNGQAIAGGTITGNRNWNHPGTDFLILGNITIGALNSLCRLTIEPGNVLRFASGVYLQPGFYNSCCGPYGGEIYAIGTSTNPITFTSMNGQPGGWNGLYFPDLSDWNGGSSTLENCIIENGNSYNISCESTVRPSINLCTIRNSLQDGIRLNSSQLSILNTVFSNNGRYPVYCLTTNCEPLLTGSTFTGNVQNYITYSGGQIGYNKTLINYGVDYYFETTAWVGLLNSKCRLTVNEGNTLRFASGTQLQIGNYLGCCGPYGGELSAVGTTSNKITFTSLNDQAGGWNGIYFHYNSNYSASVSTMTNCIVEKGSTYNLYCESTVQPAISYCIVRNSAGKGISIYNSYLSLSNTQITNNAGYGLYFNNPYYIPQLTSLTITGNSLDGVVSEGGTVSVDRTWKYFGAGNYNLLGSVTIALNNSKCRLTVKPGNTLRFPTGSSLQIGTWVSCCGSYGGELYAVGKPDSLITFTASNGTDGGWNGIYFQDNSDAFSSVSTLKYCTIEKGSTYNVYFESTNQPTMTYCTIRNSTGKGLSSNNSMPTLAHLDILNNAGYGIYFNNMYYIPQMTFLNISGNGMNGVVAEGGTLSVDRTWKYFGTGNYNLLGSILIALNNSKCRLTLMPGVSLGFAAGTQLQIGYYNGCCGNYGGELYAVGKTDSLISFLPTNGLAGGWNGIYFADQSDLFGSVSTLRHCSIEKGNTFNLYCENTNQPATLDSCIITNSNGYGISLNTSSISITSSQINYNTGNGIYINGTGSPTIGNSTTTTCDIYYNGNYDVYNNTANNINARYNFWNSSDSTLIASRIYDKSDNAARGYVYFMPFVASGQVPTGSFNITGNFKYYNSSLTPLANVTVFAKDMTGNIIGTTETDGAGNFIFSNLTNGMYKFDVSPEDIPWGGVNSTDALLIMQHFANIQVLSGLKKSAADVNKSATVNSTDALFVMKRFSQLITSFPSGDWVFDDTVKIYNSDMSSNINALCFGDINASYLNSGSKYQNLPSVTSDANQLIRVFPGNEYDIPVTVTSAMSLGAVSLVLGFPAEALQITGVYMANQLPFCYSVTNGKIYISWADLNALQLVKNDLLLFIRVKVLDQVASDNQLIFDVEDLSEFASEEAVAYEDVILNIPHLEIASANGISELNGGFSLSNYPNPFGQSTSLNFTLPQSAVISIDIFDILGQKIADIAQGYRVAGTYSVKFYSDALSSGIYYCKMDVQTGENTYSITRQLFISR